MNLYHFFFWITAKAFIRSTGLSCNISRIHSQFWISTWYLFNFNHCACHLFDCEAVSILNRSGIFTCSSLDFHCIDTGKSAAQSVNFSLRVFLSNHNWYVTDRSAISVWNENWHHFKSTGFQPLLSKWRILPKHIQCSEFRVYTHHPILCEKFLISPQSVCSSNSTCFVNLNNLFKTGVKISFGKGLTWWLLITDWIKNNQKIIRELHHNSLAL